MISVDYETTTVVQVEVRVAAVVLGGYESAVRLCLPKTFDLQWVVLWVQWIPATQHCLAIA